MSFKLKCISDHNVLRNHKNCLVELVLVRFVINLIS